MLMSSGWIAGFATMIRLNPAALLPRTSIDAGRGSYRSVVARGPSATPNPDFRRPVADTPSSVMNKMRKGFTRVGAPVQPTRFYGRQYGILQAFCSGRQGSPNLEKLFAPGLLGFLVSTNLDKNGWWKERDSGCRSIKMAGDWHPNNGLVFSKRASESPADFSN
jgi:hypothetical protein